MHSKNCFEMSFIVVEAIRGRCASFTVLTATVWEIFGGQTNSSILVLTSKEPVCPRVELILKIIIILLIIFLGFIKSKPC